MRLRPLLLCALLVSAGLLEVGSWPDDPPPSPTTSLTDLAGFAVHGHPAEKPALMLGSGLTLEGRAALPPAEHELMPPAHAHARTRSGS